MQISLPFLQRSNSDSKRWIVDLSLVFLSFSFSNLRFHSSAVSSSLTTTVFLIVLALKKSHNHKFSIVSICTANKLGKNDCIFNRFSPKTYRTVTKFPLSLFVQQASLAKTTVFLIVLALKHIAQSQNFHYHYLHSKQAWQKRRRPTAIKNCIN